MSPSLPSPLPSPSPSRVGGKGGGPLTLTLQPGCHDVSLVTPTSIRVGGWVCGCGFAGMRRSKRRPSSNTYASTRAVTRVPKFVPRYHVIFFGQNKINMPRHCPVTTVRKFVPMYHIKKLQKKIQLQKKIHMP